ncbi:AAA family ATPase [Roseomonas xinghualingensis]|uniref:AAA family ATPase n=1 Tax=Roseomonas xinghualingensis TaxID=2986475 RepID=UPI0021F1744B|nr:AAA family ATPase [Roseomonas sp. SXEYE001]MCV4209711.1 AAA family ATPase [Roseomonas sp. SXEYE001]
MRLTSLNLKRYGSFADTTLEFDPAPGRINLVLAPNGAGKSVLRTAFGELLFGIGGQTPMGFRHGYAGMQLSATGIGPDGGAFGFTRRKGNKNTLTGPDDTPLDQAWLDRLLGRADNKLLSQLFALDTERLRQGGHDLLSSGGALADALLAAAGGLREASALRRNLEEERDRLAPLRKTAQRPFYLALERWSESRRQLRQSLVRPQEWHAREKALREAEALRDASNRAAAAAGEQLRQLERIRRVRPLLARHAAALSWLEQHPDAPSLPADLASRLPEVRGAVAGASHGLEAARAALGRLEAEIAAIVTDDALLARAAEIEALVAMAGLVSQARAGLPGAEAALDAARERVAAELQRLGQPGAADPTGLLPPPALLAQLRRLAAEHAAQESASASLPRRLAEQATRILEAEQALAAMPPPGDARRLEELLAEIRREGDPLRRLATAGRGVSEAEARLATALARLPAGLRDPAALAALNPPDPTTLERLFKARDTAKGILQRRDEAVQRAEAALAATRAEHAALEAAGTPPSREALSEARARREAGWNLVFRRIMGEAPDAAAEHAYGGERPLPLAYAEAVASADRIADARLANAGRAAQAETLARTIAEREADLAAACEARNTACLALDSAGDAWEALVSPFGLDAEAGLTEAQRFLTAWEAGLAAGQELADAHAALAELQELQEGAAARLLQALEDATPAPLPALLDRAEEQIRRHRAKESERQAHQAAAAAARKALRETEGEQAAAAERMSSWQAEWDAALDRLGQPPGAAPAALDEVLQAYGRLGDALRDLAGLEAQANEWRAALERFQAGYETLCSDLGQPPAPDALAGLRELDRRQRTEAARAESRAALAGQREKAEAALRQHEAALAEAEARLRAVVAAAGAATAEAAEQRITLGTERARQETLLRAAEAELLSTGDGLPLTALRTEAEAQPADGLEEARAEQRRHAAEAQEQVAAVTTLGLEMQRLAADDMAVQAASGEAAAASLLGRTLDDALLMQVAAGLLDAALGTVQEGTDDALLRRISAAFATLTDDAYTGVTSQEDDRGTARLALRSRDFPEEETGVDQLSEGTRDQLFLALRLVAIEDHAAGGTVLPFVGDDILQSFDDGRAAAAFRALLRLSETAQVILLSHHEHLLSVLREALPAPAFHLQRL